MTATSNSAPWLSILIPTFNGEKYLLDTLDSILIQNELNIECIVIDDGSKDQTFTILERIKDVIPTRIYQSDHKGNWVANTNQAISLAKGEYICFLHQDDIWLRGRLDNLKKLTIDFPDAILLLHSSIFIDSTGNYLGNWKCPLKSQPYTIKSAEMVQKLLVQNFIAIPAPIFKRTVALQSNGMDESLWYTADWDFWLKIAKFGNTIYLPKALSGFRIHAESQTIVRSSYAEEFRHQLETVYKKHMPTLGIQGREKQKTQKMAVFSIDVNSALAGSIHNHKPNITGLLISFLSLGPIEIARYIYVSRILERILARLKAKIITRRERKQTK